MKKSFLIKALFIVLAASCITRSYGITNPFNRLTKFEQKSTWFNEHPYYKYALSYSAFAFTTVAINACLTYAQSKFYIHSNGSNQWIKASSENVMPNANTAIGCIGGSISALFAYKFPHTLTKTIKVLGFLVSLPIMFNLLKHMGCSLGESFATSQADSLNIGSYSN